MAESDECSTFRATSCARWQLFSDALWLASIAAILLLASSSCTVVSEADENSELDFSSNQSVTSGAATSAGGGGQSTAGTGGSANTATIGSAASTSSASSGAGGGSALGLRYNEVFIKSAHNAYERDEALFDQLIYHRLRSLEFDIHSDKLNWPSQAGDWYVYHDTFSPQTTCHRLSDCLKELRAFHDAVPKHEVLTAIIDLKTAFKSGQQASDLDTLLKQRLSENVLLTPADLLAACSQANTLQEAVTSGCSWPELEQLRGRIIVIVTGGNACGSSYVNSYANSNSVAKIRRAFVAPDLSAICPFSSYKNKQHVIFFNMTTLDSSRAKEVQAAGFVGRVWGLNTSTSWNNAKKAKAQLLGTDKVNHLKDSWSKTHNSGGYPFACQTGCTVPATEDATVLSVTTNSGDIWNKQDSFYFGYKNTGINSDKNMLWTAYASTPNSHVDPWAKGCLMARASLKDNAAYFAVCRPADQHPIRVQWRSQSGASSQSDDVAINPPDTSDNPSAAFIRLEILDGGKKARGLGSQNGKTWVLIKELSFPAPLLYQGVAASSHGSGSLSLAIGNLKQTITGVGTQTFAAKDLSKAAIGPSSTGSISDGL